MGLFNNDDYNKKLEEIEESFREERRNAFEKDLSAILSGLIQLIR